MKAQKFLKVKDFEIAANELLKNFSKIYHAEIDCSDLANIMSRSSSKWAEYTIKDLCLNPKNFDFIETTSMKGLGKHSIPFHEILHVIHLCENEIPYDSRVKIYTYEKSVTIQIVHHFTISFDNPYEEIRNENDFSLEKRLFSEKFTYKLCKILHNLDFSLYHKSVISIY
jgi:hypothetical protein